jgi:threonyl-tRNA synthetase
MRMAEFGACHRYEPSGALHGIMRVRAFTQDDAHIFCEEHQIASEAVRFTALLSSIYRDLGFESFRVKFSDRPAQRAGDDGIWDRAEGALHEACRIAGVEYEMNPGEGAFYGPKLEFILRDAIGRDWQCGTFQVDFVLPERLDAEYVAEDGSRKRPVMLHRAILGSFERFLGVLIEHHAGRFPLWLAPVQVVVASIVDDAAPFAREAAEALRKAGLRVETDLRNEKINRKVVDHIEQRVPVLAVVGRREAEDGTVVLRRLPGREQETMKLADAVERLAAEAAAPDLAIATA